MTTECNNILHSAHYQFAYCWGATYQPQPQAASRMVTLNSPLRSSFVGPETPNISSEENEHDDNEGASEIIFEPDLEDKDEKGKRKNGHGIPIKIVSSSKSPSSSSSTYWRNTFAFISFPLILCGLPSHVLLLQEDSSSSSSRINSTRQWFRLLLNFRRKLSNLPLTLFTCALLLLTLLINLFVLLLAIQLFKSLFILGDSGRFVVNQVGVLVIYLVQVVSVDYFWISGYKVKRLVDELDRKVGRNPGVACNFRKPLIALVLILIGTFAIRYSRPGYVKVKIWTIPLVIRLLLNFSNYIFLAFTFPIYTTFCFAIRFELLIIKTFIYEQISLRITPNVGHLNKIKRWFTQAADHAVFVNHLYWALLSVVIFIMAYDIWDDADAIVKMFRTHVDIFVAYIKHRSRGETASFKTTNATAELLETRKSFSEPEYARKVYADIVWVLLTFGFMFYTIWQAVLTNDAMKAVQNWINDFVIGGGGADVSEILRELKVDPKKKKKKEKEEQDFEKDIENGGIRPSTNGCVVTTDEKKWNQRSPDQEVEEDVVAEALLEYESESDVPLMWVGQKVENDDQDYEDMFMKVMSLKNYIVLRMKLDNPALLTIMLFGSLVPVLRDRLQNYKL